MAEQKTAPMPLEGIKIVEYGIFHAGPGGTSILGGLGADIIKIESSFGEPERYVYRAIVKKKERDQWHKRLQIVGM